MPTLLSTAISLLFLAAVVLTTALPAAVGGFFGGLPGLLLAVAAAAGDLSGVPLPLLFLAESSAITNFPAALSSELSPGSSCSPSTCARSKY